MYILLLPCYFKQYNSYGFLSLLQGFNNCKPIPHAQHKLHAGAGKLVQS